MCNSAIRHSEWLTVRLNGLHPCPAVLQKQYMIIEAYALAEDVVEEPRDYTMPDVVGIADVAGDVLDEFRDMVWVANMTKDVALNSTALVSVIISYS